MFPFWWLQYVCTIPIRLQVWSWATYEIQWVEDLYHAHKMTIDDENSWKFYILYYPPVSITMENPHLWQVNHRTKWLNYHFSIFFHSWCDFSRGSYSWTPIQVALRSTTGPGGSQSSRAPCRCSSSRGPSSQASPGEQQAYSPSHELLVRSG